MQGPINIQEPSPNNIDDNFIASLDIESDSSPTKALIHKEARFLFILSGKGKIKIQNEVHTMKRGKIISLLPWQISEIIEVDEKVTYYLLIYRFELIEFILKEQLSYANEGQDIVDLLYQQHSIQVDKDDSQVFQRAIHSLRDEIGLRTASINRHTKPLSSMWIVIQLAEIIISYLRQISNNKTQSICSEEIFRYMYLHSSEDISLNKLSEIFFLSKSTISKYIKKLTGLGFYSLLDEMRLSKAQYLLLHTDLSLTQIADTLNFSDKSRLSKLFSQHHGINSSHFKATYKKGDKQIPSRLSPRDLKLINYLYENYAEDITIDQLSKIFDSNPKDINSMLNYFVEDNFSNFLNQLRVNKACDLLIKTDLSIIDIAYQVGFNSSKTLTRNFKRILQISPSAFRKLNPKEQIRY